VRKFMEHLLKWNHHCLTEDIDEYPTRHNLIDFCRPSINTYLRTLCCRYVTGFMKTVLKGTKTKIYFILTRDKLNSTTIQKLKLRSYLALSDQVHYFYRQLSSNAIKIWGWAMGTLLSLRDINRTLIPCKLLILGALACPVDCVRMSMQHVKWTYT